MTNPLFAERITALHLEIAAAGCDGFLVPMGDEYQNEFVPLCGERLKFLSGFTGSAATIIVLKDKAAFFTDSRYTLQAAQEVPADLFALFDSAQKTPLAWLEENAGQGSKIGYDPWLHAAQAIERLKKSLAKISSEAVPVARNPIDAIWSDRPAPPLQPVVAHELAYAGKSSAEKRKEIAETLKKKDLAAFVVTDPSSVAWLLNVRGNDTDFTPLPLSRAILHENSHVEWFVDVRKVTKALPAHLGVEVTILPPDDFPAALDRLAERGKRVLLDPEQAPVWVADRFREKKGVIELGEDLCELPRAIKNPTEIEGMRAAHRRDGAALTSFLAWLDKNWAKGLSEIDAAKKLSDFRDANNNYRGPSFATISAAGAHGAIVHYHATKENNAQMERGQLYLLDSGGQYLDGTTDVTRTVVLGEPSAEMCANFTRVLKGHIALALVRFPDGTTGGELDVLARQYLWAVGLDYGHGTGHGVGAYLGVHEGPQAISKRSKVPLKPGMVLSNEPGFYKEGHYGIRIESLLAVVEIPGLGTAERKMYGFETLTLVPIDRHLIDLALLNGEELKWINAYHQRVRQVLRPLIADEAVPWLDAATEPLKK